MPLLVSIATALACALVGGLVARRLGLPTIVGYLLAGVAIGPFTPGLQADPHTIQQLAEIGVILLMFGVGLHFSFRDLWQVRRVAIPGAVVQMAVIAGIAFLIGTHWGFSTPGAWVFGIAASVASTVVVIRSLMDQGWLDSPHGKIAVGWLIVEDLLMVAILVLLPVLATEPGTHSWKIAALAIGKAVLFIALMMFAGERVVPALLGRVVRMQSRELFVLVALTAAVGTALASSVLFGVSLALGAFVAGLVISESPFSHQIGADLLPFREAFAVIFFVSIGMLANPVAIAAQWQHVLVITAIIIVAKGLVSGVLAVILGCSGRTAVILACSRTQIGEFSFILAQSGVALGVLDSSQYSLILAGAIVSIILNPFVVRLAGPLERAMRRRPGLWRLVDRPRLRLPAPGADALSNHVVIVGCGRVGRHIAEALGRLNIPRVVIESDPARLAKLAALGVPVLYGEAGNSGILEHCGLPRARALVVTLSDDAAALLAVAAARTIAPSVHIVARASTWAGAKRLATEGADEVVRPELEGGLEIVRRTLLDLDLPVPEVQHYTDVLRLEDLEESERPSAERARVLEQIRTLTRGSSQKKPF